VDDALMSDQRSAPVLPPTRAAAVAAQLRSLIVAGDLAPGTRLRQAQIAERFSTSTTPVREAFAMLAREGLVRQDAHRGVVVFAPTVEELAEIYEIRKVLEPLATEIAAPQLTAADFAVLDGMLAEMRAAESPRRYTELNLDFHRVIYAAANRPRMARIIDQLREAAASYLALTVIRYDAAYAEHVHSEHEEIVALLKGGTPKQAARAIRAHLEHNERQIAHLLERPE
jgi:DNA-binding GntR family transcriptional regulator